MDERKPNIETPDIEPLKDNEIERITGGFVLHEIPVSTKVAQYEDQELPPRTGGIKPPPADG